VRMCACVKESVCVCLFVKNKVCVCLCGCVCLEGGEGGGLVCVCLCFHVCVHKGCNPENSFLRAVPTMFQGISCS